MSNKVEPLEILMQRLPIGASIVRAQDHWQYHENGRLVSGSYDLRTLIEMEVSQKRCPYWKTCRQSFCIAYGGCDTPAAHQAELLALEMEQPE